ncbi:helix-turn-helix domain-containing protein [Saccharopolyspora pogona]|uniref:helix-turn-helix domain-containing protein n=1 Tax=Saccharopolyspora pogona TaxID=333966 RepID=UPI001686676C|nr:helix-turn-helix domain-containing protein [Saccharopolyspora pogona]
MNARRTLLIRRRKAVGHSQESLAAALQVAVSTVARWERGESDPRPWQRPKLEVELRLSTAELDELVPDASPSERGMRARSDGGLIDGQPRHDGMVTVAQLRRRVYDLDGRYDHMPSLSLLTDAAQALGQIDVLAERSRSSSRRELQRIEATAAILLGQLVWDASQRRDHQTARRYFEQAERAAREFNDPVAEGHALLRNSYLALYGEHDPVKGLRLTEHTAAVATGASDVITGLAQLHSAEAHAMVGETRLCEVALAAAETSFGHVADTDAAAHLFSPVQFDRLAGSCYLFLGDHHRAERFLGTAATATRAPTKSRAIVLGNLSLTYLHKRDLDAAVVTLHDAIDVVEANRGGGGLNLVSDAVRKLRSWQSEPVVRDIYDRVLSLMTATP